MSFKVSYNNIDLENIRKLELISKGDGLLQVLRMNPNWAFLLEKAARIKEAVSSIGVEGTVLTIDQAKAITVGQKDINVGEKEKREFLGYLESLQYVKGEVENPLSITLLLRIHEKITAGDPKASPGKVRTDIRQIKRKGRIIYTAPPPDHLNFLLNEFFNWFNKVAEDKSFSPVVAAAICHFWFVWIHPFCDGNGRVGRLLTTFLLLKKRSEGIRYFALSDYYNKNLDSYYDALEKTNICDSKVPSMNFTHNLTLWISYFIDSYLIQMESIKGVSNRILQLNIRIERLREEGMITETHSKTLSFLSSRERASYQELMDHLGVSKPRVNQILKPLRKAHILTEETIGKTVWFGLGAPEDETDETALIKKKLKDKSSSSRKTPKNKGFVQAVLPFFWKNSENND